MTNPSSYNQKLSDNSVARISASRAQRSKSPASLHITSMDQRRAENRSLLLSEQSRSDRRSPRRYSFRLVAFESAGERTSPFKDGIANAFRLGNRPELTRKL